MGLLGVLLIDRQAGAAFYGEASRMERDLLGDAARARILLLFGRLGAPWSRVEPTDRWMCIAP